MMGLTTNYIIVNPSIIIASSIKSQENNLPHKACVLAGAPAGSAPIILTFSPVSIWVSSLCCPCLGRGHHHVLSGVRLTYHSLHMDSRKATPLKASLGGPLVPSFSTPALHFVAERGENAFCALLVTASPAPCIEWFKVIGSLVRVYLELCSGWPATEEQ